jgi:elongation factor P
MLSYNELKPGVLFILDGQPFEVLESEFLRMQQRKPVMKTKIKSLISSKIIDRSFQPSDQFEEAEVEKMKAQFIYENRGEYWFNEVGNPKNRFALKSEIIGDTAKFLKPNLETSAIKFGEKIINVELPIKIDYKIIEAPPAIRGDTAQGGTKVVILETGAKINAPLFINEGDTIRINTQTATYVERVEKVG